MVSFVSDAFGSPEAGGGRRDAAGEGWRPLQECCATPSVGESLTFLRALNNLQDAEGRPYASRVTYHGIDAWWCRQQEVYDHYLRPFLRYEPLLARAVAGGMVRIRACPPELRRIVRQR